MKIAEALNLLENGDWFQAVYSTLSQNKADEVADAINTVAAAIKRAHDGEPLNLEQLREMDGEPVWVKCLNPKKYVDPPVGWRILEKSITGHVGVWNGDNCLAERDYETDWLFYAYPPAHIDREAWSDCPYCGEDLFSEYGFRRMVMGESGDYCKYCGKPQTEEAWDELEKRLRG